MNMRALRRVRPVRRGVFVDPCRSASALAEALPGRAVLPEPRIIGKITSEEDLRLLLRERADAVNLSRERIDEIAGISKGLTGTLLAEHGARELSLLTGPAVAGALGCVLILAEDPDQVARVCGRWKPRDRRFVNYGLSRTRPKAAPDGWAVLRARRA
jgi:hypothetical protein